MIILDVRKKMKSELIALLTLVLVVSVACYFTIWGKEMTSDSIDFIVKIIVASYFMYFIRDIAVSLRTIAKKN